MNESTVRSIKTNALKKEIEKEIIDYSNRPKLQELQPKQIQQILNNDIDDLIKEAPFLPQYNNPLPTLTVRQREAVNNEIKKVVTNNNKKINISDAIEEANTQYIDARNDNIDVNPNLTNKLIDIENRTIIYSESLKGLSDKEKRKIISQYKADLSYIQKKINNIELNNIELYAEHNALLKKREDLVNKLRQDIDVDNLPKGVTLEQVIFNNQYIVNLDATINKLIATAKSNNNLSKTRYVQNLKEIKNELVSNTEVQIEYIKSRNKAITRSFNSLPNQGLFSEFNQLKQLEEIVKKSTQLSKSEYESISYQLEQLYKNYKNQFKKVSSVIKELDLKYVDLENGIVYHPSVSKANSLIDFQKGLNEIRTRIIVLNNKLSTYNLSND